MTIEPYWIVIAFLVGGVTGALLVALMAMAARHEDWMRLGRRDVEREADSLVDQMPHRDDGTRAVNTVTRFEVDDGLGDPSFPYDNSKIKYWSKP